MKEDNKKTAACPLEGVAELDRAKPETGPIECLGMTFDSDDSRRRHFSALLAKTLNDREFGATPGLPSGTDQAILNLSNPPYYTACPNPFLADAVADFAHKHSSRPQTEQRVVPFATDISEGKGEHFYNIHTYHTKVPYRAIARFLLHYTRPGDVVLDAFCGSGMVGLAAQACGNAQFVAQITGAGQTAAPAGADSTDIGAGERLAILVDLSPAATHIAANYNDHPDIDRFSRQASAILNEFRSELGWMFTTRDPDTEELAPVDYYVWSDIFACPDCGRHVSFWDAGIDRNTGYKTSSGQMSCPACGAVNARDRYERVIETRFDDLLGQTARRQKERLVLVAYRHNGQKKTKAPDDFDAFVLERIATEPIADPVPVRRMMDRDGSWGDMFRSGYHAGITHVHHFYSRRSLRAMAWLWRRVGEAPRDLRMRLRWWLQSVGVGHTRLNRYFTSSYSQVNRYLKGFLYVAQVRSEVAPWYSLTGKIDRMAAGPPGRSPVFISTGSANRIGLTDKTVDYIFTDPPFGGNIIYSELNFLWEAWLGVTTCQDEEAIVSAAQNKGLADYERLMENAFREYFRLLKPGKWISILFHNSRNSVWRSIQNALQRAGFVVADVRVFDKKQLTMKQQTAAGTVQKDLLLTAYRPAEAITRAFDAGSGCEKDVWQFVSGHLSLLPVAVKRGDDIEQLAERMNFTLYDRMIAFFVERGIPVPMSAGEFYAGLTARYPQRDEMYFLADQVAHYDRERARADSLDQVIISVIDEASAIRWLGQQLQQRPQSFQELQPIFLREIQTWAGHERTVELGDILEQNFLCYDGTGPVPSQIHSYLSSKFKDMRRRNKDDQELRGRASGRWYIPDPGQQADLARLRERMLLREFEQYKAQSRSQVPGTLEQVRSEALRAGFKAAYSCKDYQTIVSVAARLPEKVIQDDDKLLMYHDVASMRLGRAAM
ncbi:MAG: site-specific DNA-methyltransferase [Proteobacteria bacterium]|nr:site-specific DNA-methyltransferase [Pseudomonadota bacterium]